MECFGRILKRAHRPWRVAVPDIELTAHKLPEPHQRIRALTTDEDKALFAAIDKVRPDYRDMIEFTLLTGKRLSEVIGLKKCKVDRKAMEARVVQKGGQEVVIALTESTLAIIERNWLNHPECVFTYVRKSNRVTHREGRRYPFTQNGWRKEWKAILLEANLEDFRFHDLRHTTATRILSATGNLKAVQDLLNHADISSSARYAHTVAGQRRDALRAAEKLRVPEKSQNPESQNTHSEKKTEA